MNTTPDPAGKDSVPHSAPTPDPAPDPAPDPVQRAASATPERGYRTFLHVLGNTLVANVTTSFLWFALTFWIYAETRNVVATGVIGASYMLLISVFSMFFGTLVDKYRKKAVMLWATVAALAVVVIDSAFFFALGPGAIADLTRPWFWIFAFVLLAGCVVEQLRGIALSTTVTLLVEEDRRAKANGLVGTVQGVGLIVTSVFSGLSVGFLGMGWTLLIGLGALVLVIAHLVVLRVPEQRVARPESGDAPTGWVDIRGGWRAVRGVPGLLALVVFTTFNNLFAGVYMALMDPYGIEMFGVKGWGIWFAVMSTGIIVGGLVVAATGLGANPIRFILLAAAMVGVAGALSTLREWGWLYIVGVWAFMFIMPFAEAAEQTVVQKVVPYERQGRVFGFAMTFEAASAPVTSFLVAPLAQFWVIPYMRTDAGRARWEWLLGAGESRGIALLLLIAGVAGIVLAAAAFVTPQYRLLSRRYREAPGTPPQAVAPPAG